MTITEIQEEIIDEFSMFDDWMERYEYIIELGKSLPIISDQYKLDENLIKGCQSKVWLYSELDTDKIKLYCRQRCYFNKGHCSIIVARFL